MKQDRFGFETLTEHLVRAEPDHPILYFNPETLKRTIDQFQSTFPGLVTFAVKANPDPTVIACMAAFGLRGFDVASPQEIDLVRTHAPNAVLHYNNPVRSRREISYAAQAGVASYAVDRFSELQKLADLIEPKGIELAVRLKLPIDGSAYDFGEKYGASPENCVGLLRHAAKLGFIPSMTFHPGTQCREGASWESYIKTCAEIARKAGVTLRRLNVGGGYPSQRRQDEDDRLPAIFTRIEIAIQHAFEKRPELVCEPGRAMIAEACTLAVRVKSIDEDDVTLNDGVYGGLSEFRDIYPVDRITAVNPAADHRRGKAIIRPVFGPTCDSLDTLPGGLSLPADIEEEDYLLIKGMGAYVIGINSRFNGYGAIETVQVRDA
ncbi:MAG: type III PLP-dependent enzyme [Pseudomonadota bacterium]